MMENQMNQKPNVLMCVLSYLGILSLIPYLTEKNDEHVQFHAKQGLNLFIIEVIVSVVCSVFSFVPVAGLIASAINGICGIFFLVLAILGIVAAVQGEKKELPVISAIKIIK